MVNIVYIKYQLSERRLLLQILLIAPTELTKDREFQAWHRVTDKIPDGGRIHAEIDGRHVSIVSWRGDLFCLDSLCFHGGGPLAVGNIEEIDGKACLECPWHHYMVSSKVQISALVR
jgi:nitrite reductase/ring-hydroxylating ferredoxin subunit